MSDERDFQYENDLEMVKLRYMEEISSNQIVKRMTNQFRHEDDHVYAITVNRSASEARDYFYRDIVKCDTLWASGHRFCFKNLRDIRDFLEFFEERFGEECKRIEDYCDDAYPDTKKAQLAVALQAVVDPVCEERFAVCDLLDKEVVAIARHTNYRDKE
jgi:hypothetical protein